MFFVLAGPPTSLEERVVGAFTARQRACVPRIWIDAHRRGAAGARIAGTLPEDAHDAQPLCDVDLVFVCRVRLDNRAEILAKLGGRSNSSVLADSSVLFLAYKQWGEDCMQHLSGDYAFVAWHPDRQRVVAAVDHCGSARAYWTRTADAVLIAGDLVTILAHPAVSRRPDLQSLARLLDVGHDRCATPFSDIRAIPGGHSLVWQAGSIRVRRWWRPDGEARLWYRNPRSYVEQASELLECAVRASLRASGAIASTLSGGLDSGLVTALAARHLRKSGRELAAYTSIPERGLPCSTRAGWDADESALAASVAAAHDNLRHVFVSPGKRCGLDLLSSLITETRAPARNLSNLLWADAISKSCLDRGGRIVLTGQSGNATVSWSGAGATAELLRMGRMRAAFALMRQEARFERRTIWRATARAIVGPRTMNWFTARRAVGAPPPMPAELFVRPELRPQPNQREGSSREAPGTRARWIAFITTPKNTWWPDPLTTWGVDWRDPMADRMLIETLLSFPLAAFKVDGRSRGLARAIGSGLLPDVVRLRCNQGAQVPELPSLIARDAQRYRIAIHEMLASDSCRALLDLTALGLALERIAAGHLDYYFAISFERAHAVGVFLHALDQEAA